MDLAYFSFFFYEWLWLFKLLGSDLIGMHGCGRVRNSYYYFLHWTDLMHDSSYCFPDISFFIDCNHGAAYTLIHVALF